MTAEDTCSESDIQKAELEDPDIRPILEKKLKLVDRPSRQEIAQKSPATKRSLGLLNILRMVTRQGPKTEERNWTGWTSAEKLSDRTPRFPCDILFGRPKNTPFSLTNSEARLKSVQASARE
ncbi:hypothetical protein AVEN_67690-1 [Araneus ventricosus]|uniref:Uncharacterized protein n=1 Tax=Araneus ventricosus TaxID=182803 RepID=A0A4Y1ZME7_ARAVE|nr:hypothetical protein AVEN_67690-1 [Araneus ventricosus]